MISVDNFYWVIYETLLKPCKLDAKYFYPFGTLNKISEWEYNGWKRQKFDRYALFIDQEPLYQENLVKIDKIILQENWFKTLKLLANSEMSEQKEKFCNSTKFLDWYFFYHGFAALDWFRDCQYVTSHSDIKHPFLCLNHLVKHKRSYRMSLLARLVELECHKNGEISFHGDLLDCKQELNDIHTELSNLDKKLIEKNLFNTSLVSLPLQIDTAEIDGDFSARSGFHEHKLWQESLFHIVTETIFYDRRLHLTEKIFKPIVAERPFILVSSPGNLAYLKSYGFRTFDRWVDESYDGIEDNDARLDHIANEIARLSNMALPQLKIIHQEMKEVLDFNKKHFFGNFKKNIVDEMVDNFETCLRLWNNGRVNHRCPFHPNLQQAKEILYR